MSEKKHSGVFRYLPPIDEVLRTATAQDLAEKFGTAFLTELARKTVENLREELRLNKVESEISREILLAKVEDCLQIEAEKENRRGVKKVINATGVIIHTNLGRAPLAEKAIRAVVEESSRYCTLEYDLETGKRGKRGGKVEQLLCELTGAESAIVVNNCAAATFFVLSALASGGETVISRGEMVEIGGDFRIPDVMQQAGTKLVEVGTTNRTKLRDFANAINENTRILLRVHPSNFRIVGFTEMPNLAELANLAHEKDLILFEDAGSGALFDFAEYGLTDEPIISVSIKQGVDIVAFSGDKLLGACQSGIIAGKAELIEKLRKHPLYRALRLDKIAYSILEATLEIYRNGTQFAEIPVLQAISMTEKEIEKRAQDFVRRLNLKLRQSKIENLKSKITEGVSAIGGGSAPNFHPKTTLISIAHEKFSAVELEEKLRSANPPVITRIYENRVMFDLRTVFTEEEEIILNLLTAFS